MTFTITERHGLTQDDEDGGKAIKDRPNDVILFRPVGFRTATAEATSMTNSGRKFTDEY